MFMHGLHRETCAPEELEHFVLGEMRSVDHVGVDFILQVAFLEEKERK